MPLKSAGILTKFKAREVEQFFNQIKFRYRKVGLEILLAPRSLDYGRLLISVPRRAGNAPQRNRFKRRIKAIYYESKLFELPFDWAVIVKGKDAALTDFTILKATLTQIADEAIKKTS